jgi:MOSC domain-containing protein
LIDSGSAREEAWAGMRLLVGDACLQVTEQTERCVMVGQEQATLPKRKQLLNTVGRWNALCAGMYADVLRPGRMRVGDPVYLLRDEFNV